MFKHQLVTTVNWSTSSAAAGVSIVYPRDGDGASYAGVALAVLQLMILLLIRKAGEGRTIPQAGHWGQRGRPGAGGGGFLVVLL